MTQTEWIQSLGEAYEKTGRVMVVSNRPYNPGDVLPTIYNVNGLRTDTPAVVVRAVTRDDFLEWTRLAGHSVTSAHLDYIGATRFYEVAAE
ncbi:MAG: hypothetical protein KGL39_25495 [Patescibacteria group bacterium]|nr:hypothetical protein [Patescibacteria group bacterium]